MDGARIEDKSRWPSNKSLNNDYLRARLSIIHRHHYERRKVVILLLADSVRLSLIGR